MECGGLPPGKCDELFRPFEQRSANRTGLGLGLSICRKGVEAMGGKIGVRDLQGKGCVFSIELPRLPAA
ncbi:MAG TPA: HAMP domain-containing sensor histidine kinase [Sorangium sp.]|nr:HAMP domain-containing sensor histidine kinase [Sorangium sp.]